MNFYAPYMYTFSGNMTAVLFIVVIWSLLWKGYALWTAAKNNQKKWFIALVILNTLGILEIFYIFYIARKKWADVEKDLSKIFS